MTRLIWFEFEKLRHNRFLIAVLAIILFVNATLYYTTFVSRSKTGFSDIDEHAVYEELSLLEDSDKLQSVQEKIDQLQANHQTNIDSSSGSPIWTEKLYEKIEDDMIKTLSYEEILRDIKANADYMTQSSVFSQPNSFSFRNAKCTAQQYASIRNTDIPIMYSGGVLRIVNSQISDICFVLATILVVLFLWTHEYEQGYTNLIQAAKYGRTETILAKSISLIIFQVFIFLILYGTDFILVTKCVGLGDLSNPLQSIHGFLLSPLQVSVGQYLFIFYVHKLLAFIAISLAFLTISIAIRSTTVSCIIFGIILFAEKAAYIKIPANSYLSLLKQANLIALLDTNAYFSTCSNINFFEYPIALLTVMRWMILIICILSFPLSIWFSKRNIALRVPVRKSLTRPRRPRIYPTSLLYFEWYKLFWVQKGLLILLLCAVVQMATYTGYGERHIGRDEFYYMEYVETLSSMSAAQKEDFLSKEEERFHQAHQAITQIQKQYEKEEISASAKDYFVSEQYEVLAPEKAFSTVYTQYAYLTSIGETDLINQVPYELLFGKNASKEDLIDVVKVVFCIAVGLSSIWAYEEDKQTSKLIISSISGRKKTMSAKFFVSVFYVILLILVVFIPKYIAICKNVGMPGLFKPAICCPLLSFLPRNISIFSYILMQNVCRLFGALCFSSLVILTSCKIKSAIETIVLNLLIGLFPIVTVAFNLSNTDCFFSLLPAMSGHCLALKYWWVYLIFLLAATLLLIELVLNPRQGKRKL